MTAGFADLVRAALAAGHPARVPVTGTSMAPALTGGTVLVEPADFDRLRPGEVVAYRHGDRIVVHRVAAHRGDHLVTAGDNLPLYDPPVPRSAVLGRVPGVAARCADTPAAPAGPLPDEVTLWLAGAAARLAPRPGRFHPRVAVRRLTSSDPRALGGVSVGISPAAVRPVQDLRTGPAGRGRAAHRLDIVIGCSFGQPAADDPTVLTPGAVEHHLRAGPPLCQIGPGDEIRAVLTALGVPAAQPAGAP